MATKKTKIREIISEYLEVNTNALVDDEIRELSAGLADRLVDELDEVEDDGESDERNDDLVFADE